MNTLERIPEVGQRVLHEAKTAFLGNMQLSKELQGLLTPQCQGLGPHSACGHQTCRRAVSKAQDSTPTKASRRKPQPGIISKAPLVRWVLALSFLITMVNLRLYAM